MRRRVATALALLAGAAGRAAGAHAGEAPGPATAALVYALGVAVVAYVLVRTVQLLVRPGEHDGDHVKRRVLRGGRP